MLITLMSHCKHVLIIILYSISINMISIKKKYNSFGVIILHTSFLVLVPPRVTLRTSMYHFPECIIFSPTILGLQCWSPRDVTAG